MPATGSDPPFAQHQPGFNPESPSGSVVQLLSDLGLGEGVVLELGCGYGLVAEPLAELGLDYVGIDADKDALDDLRGRGIACFEADLVPGEALRQQVLAAASHFEGKRVCALSLGDMLGRWHPLDDLLESLRELSESLDNPPLVVSVPNVSHVDLGAKLVLGRFDYTPTGLLDKRLLTLFTQERLQNKLGAFGWREVAANDFRLHRSDQSFPALHPAIATGSSFSRFVRHWRNEVDDTATVDHFVRAFLPTRIAVPGPQSPVPVKRTFLTVVMRTEGSRNQNLREALTCLAAQDCDDFRVELMVHSSSTDRVGAVQSLVDEFDAGFASRCGVRQVVGGQRARPLNEALDLVDSDYVAFLDDDDLVTGDWVSTFLEGARASMGQVVRCVTVDQQVSRPTRDGARADYLVHTGMHAKHASTFDMVQHFYANQTPICSFAVPAATIECFGLRFDEGLPVTEDWEFLLRTTQIAGVHDTMRVTSVYRRWVTGECSMNAVDSGLWEGTRTGILHRFDQVPLLLPAGSANRLFELYESNLRREQANLDLQALADERMDVIDELREQTTERWAVIEELREQTSERMDVINHLREESAVLRRDLEAIRASSSWRVTAPARRLVGLGRRIVGLVRRAVKG